jgi:membrane-associated phospholipid phosphatase
MRGGPVYPVPVTDARELRKWAAWLLVADAAAARELNALTRRSHNGQIVARLTAAWLAGAEVVVLLGLAASGRRQTALRMLLAVGTVYGAAEVLGRTWQRERPFQSDAAVEGLLEHGSGRSFPSRHVASGLAMAAVASDEHTGISRLMAALAWLLGLSRVASGLHYPSDVLAGAVLGTFVGRWWRA